MDERKRHIIEDIPASELPEELRGGIDPTEIVTITVAVKDTPEPSFAEIFASHHDSRVHSDDPVLRIRALREEWDDRDRLHDQIRRGGLK
jgi:hypothetical protein